MKFLYLYNLYKMLGYIISDKNQISVENNEICSFNILNKTDLNIFVIYNNRVLYKNNIINNACFYGHVQVLEWFKNSGYEFEYNYAIFYASCNGHVQVLEWFKNSGYEFKYSEDAINHASENGHVQVLEWFKNSGYEFKYDERAFKWASRYGQIQVLEWFKNSGYEFKYNSDAIDLACENEHIQVLEWFKNSGYKLKYSRCIFETYFIKLLKFYSHHFNIKKLIIFSDDFFVSTVKFKTKTNYLKGYKKN